MKSADILYEIQARMNFRDNIVVYTLVPLITILIIWTYARFMIQHDYIVAYEGACDVATDSCFIGCEDDECTSTYYFAQVRKQANNLYAQCGPNITDCDNANGCLLQNDEGCSVTYCDPEVDGDACETITMRPLQPLEGKAGAGPAAPESPTSSI